MNQRQLVYLVCILLLATTTQAQHLLEKRHTLQSGLPTTETGNAAEDAQGYLWIVSPNGILSRYDGQTFQRFNEDRTGGKRWGRIFNVGPSPNAYASISLQDNNQRYALLRGDSVLPYPQRSYTRYGVDAHQKTILLFGKDSIYLTAPGQARITEAFSAPKPTGYELYGASRWTEDRYHLHYTQPGAPKLHYFLENGDTTRLTSPFQESVYWLLPDGSYLNYGQPPETEITRHFPNGQETSFSWREQFVAPATLILGHQRLDKFYLQVQHAPRQPNAPVWFSLYIFNPSNPGKLTHLGSFNQLTGNSHNISFDSDGTIYSPSHMGLRVLTPYTQSYPSGGPDVIGSMHAIGQIGNGDIYIGGYGTGFMRIQRGWPERLPVASGLPNQNIMPGSFATAKGGLFFLNESYHEALTHISPGGQLTSHPLLHQRHRNTGFRFDTVTLPAASPLFGNPTATGQRDFLAVSMVASPNTDEPHGRIGFVPLPYAPSNPTYVVGSSKGIRTRNILCTTQDQQGRIWFGHGSTGIGVYDPARDTAITWLIEQPTDPGAISILLDKHDNLWLGSLHGLRYIPNASKVPFDTTLHLRHRQKISHVRRIPDSYVASLTLLGKDTLAVGHTGGLTLVDLNSPDLTQPKAITLPISNYLGGAEQNATLVDQEGKFWLVADEGAVRLDLPAILRGRRMPGKVEIAVRGDQDERQYVDQSTVNIPVNDRSISYNYRLAPADQRADIMRVDAYLLTAIGDTLSARTNLPPSEQVRLNYLPPGTYTLLLETYVDNQQIEARRTTIIIPKRLIEQWYFWPVLLLLVGLPIVLYLLLRYQRTKARLHAAELENQAAAARLEASELRGESDRLQVSTLSNAVNPHFISNAITWLQSAYLVGRPVAKMDEMSENLAHTIRTMFTNSTDGRASHSLNDELELVERYLNTVNIQYDGRYTFSLPPTEERRRFSEWNVLLMHIQVHVENAVEHGLRYRRQARNLMVHLEAAPDGALLIHIEDDGAGVAFVQERQHRQGYRSGKGTEIMRRLQATFNKYNALPLKTEITSPIQTDAAGHHYGTRVTITVPTHYTYVIESPGGRGHPGHS